jgi:hypothetical protein
MLIKRLKRMRQVLILASAILALGVWRAQGQGRISGLAGAVATYSDGKGSYSANLYTSRVKVVEAASLTVTPDAGTVASVVPGQTGVKFVFRVTNTGNISDQVRFLANGQSFQITGPGAIRAAVIDVNADGNADAGDTNVFTNGADVLSASIARSGYMDVIAVVSVNTGATAGAAINVGLAVTITGGPTRSKKRGRRANRAPSPGPR